MRDGVNIENKLRPQSFLSLAFYLINNSFISI